MLEQLNTWDTSLFLLINRDWANPFFDVIMPWLREMWLWAPLYLLVGIYLVRRYGWLKTLYLALFIAAMIFVGDDLICNTAKYGFKRLRPCHEPSLQGLMISRVGCGGQYGYFSAHATNHFALALFFIMLLKKRFRWVTFVAIFWAFLVCLAQVYVGKHYPFDVLTGALVGSLLGWGFARLACQFVKGLDT